MGRYENVKDYLRRARTLDIRITALQETRDRLWKLALSVSVPSYGAWSPRGSDASNPTESRYLRIAALDERINAEIDHLVDAKVEILDAIAQMHGDTLQTTLTLYYIDCLPTWEDVARRMHYSRDHVVKILHPAALREINETLKDATKCHSNL